MKDALAQLDKVIDLTIMSIECHKTLVTMCDSDEELSQHHTVLGQLYKELAMWTRKRAELLAKQ